MSSEPRQAPCTAVVFDGLLDPGHTCGRPEDDPVHDPLGHQLGAEGRPHPYSKVPPVDGAFAGCWLCSDMGDGLLPVGWIYPSDIHLETHLYDELVERSDGEVVPANRCSCNPLPDDGPCGAAVGTSVCGRGEADPIHDPFAAGSGATASGHQFVPLATERPQHIEAA